MSTPRKFASFVTAAVAATAIGATTCTVAIPAAADPIVAPADGTTTYTAYAATVKNIGEGANTWGTFPTDEPITVWTEALVNGNWSRSQVGKTNSSGYYVLPLTYGVNSAGTYTFRVRGTLTDGTTVTSKQFTVKRRHQPTAHSAGYKFQGLGTNAWGDFDTNQAMKVWTEVWANGKWNTSQIGKTNSSGYYALPLTYGSNTPGTYTFRVRGQYPNGTTATSKQFTLQRVGAPTAYAASTKTVGATGNAWGRYDTPGAIKVWSEVWANGRWNTSQIGKTSSSGSYVIPLTYGSNTPGSYTFRIRGQYSDGTISTTQHLTVNRTPKESSADKAVAFANSQIGDSYRYGGTGPNSWDCSGLTGGAWKAAGVNLPRTSQQQYAAGSKISKSQLQPGDLVFYYSGRSHVAIYVGNGEIVHASRPGTPVQKVSVDLMPYNGAVRPA